jgi:uncharacterized membrane protein YqhA
MVERILQSSRFLVYVAVFATAILSLMIYLSCANIVFHMVQEVVVNLPSSADQGKTLAVKLLKLLDLLLIGITLQVIAVSLYRLFITPIKVKESHVLNALHIEDFHDLKITLIQVAVVILVILFLEHAVELGGTLETLYLGIAIGIVMAASTFAWRWMK